MPIKKGKPVQNPTQSKPPQPEKVLKQKRLSLQHQQENVGTSSPAGNSPRRNTIHLDNTNVSPKGRNKFKTISILHQPTIVEEVDVEEQEPATKSKEVSVFTIEEDRKSSKSARLNGGRANPSFEYDNFNTKLSRSGSVNNSIKSASDSRLGGSVQSLEVVREQYCCFQRKTKLERVLFVMVFVLSIIVLALIVVIIALAKHKSPLDSFQNVIDSALTE